MERSGSRPRVLACGCAHGPSPALVLARSALRASTGGVTLIGACSSASVDLMHDAAGARAFRNPKPCRLGDRAFSLDDAGV